MEPQTVARFGLIVSTVFASFGLWLLLPFVQGSRPQLANRTVSSIHAITVCILASKALAQNDVELGSISLCISLGYFVFDLFIIVQQQEEPFWALVAHHILSGGALGVAAISIPEAVWFANLGQCSESCLPLMFLVWLLEQRGHHKPTVTLAYTITRWVQLIMWVLMRIVLFIVFLYTLYNEWSGLCTFSRAMGAVTGPFLLAFNIGGLVTLIAPGCPWWPGTPYKPKKTK